MIIALINTKGGVGKTTSAIALAEISERETLLVDASQESNLTAFCQVDPAHAKQHNIETWIRKRDKAAIVKAGRHTIIPATAQTASDGLKLSALPPYPFTVIDTQPTLSKFVYSIAELANVVIIPCDMDLYSVESAGLVAKLLGKKCKILPTKYRWYKKIDRELLHILPDEGCEVLRPVRYSGDANKISFDGRFADKKMLSDYRKSFEGVL